MTTTPFSLPVPGGMLSFTANGPMFTPTTSAQQGGVNVPFALPQIGNLPLNLSNLSQGGTPPDLSGLVSALTPVITAAFPQIAPFLPIIGVVLNILHILTTQNTAAIADGKPNEALQRIHDAAWSQVLGAFAPKATTGAAAG